jgi:hypothetical protein
LPDTSNRVRINDVEPAQITEIPDEPVPRRSRSPVEREPEPVVTVQNNRNQTPEHPFRNAKDATYAPPQLRNIGAPAKPAQPVAKKPEPAYRTLPAIHDPSIANTIYNRALETPFTITHLSRPVTSPDLWPDPLKLPMPFPTLSDVFPYCSTFSPTVRRFSLLPTYLSAPPLTPQTSAHLPAPLLIFPHLRSLFRTSDVCPMCSDGFPESSGALYAFGLSP